MSAHLPTGETFSVNCPLSLETDSPTPEALERALSLLWDQREGNASMPRPVFAWVPSCTNDEFTVEHDRIVASWRGSLACSAGFSRGVYAWNNVAHGMNNDAALADEARLGSRTEELMTGVLIANGL